jgi:hypothetical protein
VDDLANGQLPTLKHIIQDIFVCKEKLTIIYIRMKHSVDRITKAQLIANIIQAPYLESASTNTCLFSCLIISFQPTGSMLCKLKVLEYISKGTILDTINGQESWRSVITPPRCLTNIHYDYNGACQLMLGISTNKLWLLWLGTKHNLNWFTPFCSRTPSGRETLEAISHLEGLTLYHQKGHDAFIIPSYHFHSVMTFETSVHCGSSFWSSKW